MILLIGHGYWGKNIAKTLNEELYAVCDSDPSVLDDVKNLYPHTKLYNTIEEALEDSNIKGVIIATKAVTHFDIAKKVISSKRHLWIEKPACVNVKQINELIELSEKQNTKIFVDHIMCHDSTIKYLKKNVNLGKSLFFESYRLHQGMFQPDVSVIYDLAIHDLSIIDYLFPGIELLNKQVITNSHVNNLADHAVLNLKFNNGLRATITCSWVSPVKQRQIFIGGTDAVMHLHDGIIDVMKLKEGINENYLHNSFESTETITVEQQPGLAVAVDSFKKMIELNQSPITDIYQSKRIQQWIEQ